MAPKDGAAIADVTPPVVKAEGETTPEAEPAEA